MREMWPEIRKHPMSVLYGTLLLCTALAGSISGLFSGAWGAAAVDLVMACLLLLYMFKNLFHSPELRGGRLEEWIAWLGVIGANLLILVPESNLSGSMLRACSFVFLLMSVILHFSHWRIALYCLPATLWCCLFIPFHEELMLMASFPLRLSATMLASLILKILGTGVAYSGTSLYLADLNIAITDACSGINQLDAFLLLAYIVVKLAGARVYWQVVHFAFVIPSIIIANALRIVLTVLLFKMFGEVILGKFWHVALGYGQVIAALLIFVAVGNLFGTGPEKKQEDKA